MGVEEVIRLARQARLSNVGIVCTKSDVSDGRFFHILNNSTTVAKLTRNEKRNYRTFDPKKL